jgi:putative DNA primase/helicase
VADALTSFLEAMRAEGIEPQDASQIVSGKFIRFRCADDKPNRESGYCIFHDDEFPAGFFGDFRKHGELGVNWKLSTKNPGRQLSPQEKSDLAMRIKERKLEREAALQERIDQCALESARIWRQATPAVDHPYLERKGIRAHIARELDGELLIPVTRAGELVGLQRISSDGEKRFKFGTPMHASYAVIGKPESKVVICEGYATGATIYETTNIPTVIAFNASNLEPVARVMREKLGADSEIIIAADDDRWGKAGQNAGITNAERAAAAVRGVLRRPHFPPETHDTRPTDFNDLAAAMGNDEVRDQIELGTPAWALASVETKAQDAAETPFVSEMRLLEPYPQVNGKGKPKPTLANLRELIGRCGVIVRYNVISKDREILVPHGRFTRDNGKNAALGHVVNWCKVAGIPTEEVNTYLTIIADENLYNPVATWITSQPWDGRSRLQEFFATIKAQNEQDNPLVKGMKETLLKRWMISAIAAAFSADGVSAHGVLVFQGRQYLGKTQWFKRLAPTHLKVIADGQMLKPDDKDSVKQVVSKWLVELGELDATFRRADIAQLKAFITRDSDTIRQPYAREESHFARRTVFFASVNQTEFLADSTGNRRYWTIECEEINHAHTIDMQQLWAEFYQLYLKGESWMLDAQEMQLLNEHNSNFEVRDPITERLASRLNWQAEESRWEWRSATEILRECDMQRPTQSELNRVAGAIKSLAGKLEQKRSRTAKLLKCPPVKYDPMNLSR